MKDNLISQITALVQKAQDGNTYYQTIYSGPDEKKGKNRFLFFIKPEITVKSAKVKIDEILGFILKKMEEFHFTIENIHILSAKYLADYNLIAAHYGVINKLSSAAIKNISKSASEKFESLFNKKSDEARIIGSLEFIDLFPEFTPETLDYLSQNIRSEKIAPGTYVQRLVIDGEEIFLVNGFHPRQLMHFTAPGRSIVTFTLSSDTDWNVARNDFTGKTNPEEAKKGSIRNELLMKKDLFGLDSVSSSRNGVHLSAGPVEALAELVRYNSDFSENKIIHYTDYPFGRELLKHFSDKETEEFLNNAFVEYEGKQISVFDLTEEMNSDAAIEKLKKAKKLL